MAVGKEHQLPLLPPLSGLLLHLIAKWGQAESLNQICKITSRCAHYVTNEENMLRSGELCTKFFECRANSL